MEIKVFMYFTLVEGGYWHKLNWSNLEIADYVLFQEMKAIRCGRYVFDFILLKRKHNPFRTI